MGRMRVLVGEGAGDLRAVVVVCAVPDFGGCLSHIAPDMLRARLLRMTACVFSHALCPPLSAAYLIGKLDWHVC